MKKIFVMTAFLLFTFSIFANAADFRIGYVDMNEALNASDAGKEAVNRLEEMVQEKQKIIDRKGSEIRDLDEELTKQAAVLNPESLREKQEEREKLMRDYQRMVKDSQEEIQRKQSAMMKDIIDEIREVVKNIGEEEEDLIILEKAESGTLYIPDKFDMTERVISRFNKLSEEKQ